MGRFDMLGSISVGEYHRRCAAIGATPVKLTITPPDEGEDTSRVTAAATLAGGAIGAFLWGVLPKVGAKHPVLGFIDGMALGGNIARAVTKEIPVKRALENLGAHAVATASSIALNRDGTSWVKGAIGYAAGAAGSNLIIKRPGSGYMERLDETTLGGISRKRFGSPRALPPLQSEVESVGIDEAPSDGPPSGTDVFLDPATVTVVQKELAKEHSDVKADGVAGPITKSALRDYNAKHATASDGPYITERTLSAMKINPLGSPAIHTMSVRRSEVDVEQPIRPKRPWWEILLAGLGILVAGAAIYFGVSAEGS